MITVVGLGFVGLTTALGFCHKGQVVYGIDHDEKRVASLQGKQVPFFEPGLQDALAAHVGKNFLLGTDLKTAVDKSRFIFLCVGTPQQEDGSVNLRFVEEALDELAPCLLSASGKILIIKSTVPPTTTEQFIIPYLERKGAAVGRDIHVVNNPEFLREGHAWEDFVHPDRVVIGVADATAGTDAAALYAPFDTDVYQVSLNTAEFIKYLSNSLLSTMISFSNDMSMMASAIDHIDIAQAFKILHADKRWFGQPANMSSYVYPGCGFGGTCLPKDTTALLNQAERFGYSSRLLKEVMAVNARVKDFVVEQVGRSATRDETIGILGLAFKPGTDDVRGSPSGDIIKNLLDRGYAKIVAYDPMAMKPFQETYAYPITYAQSLDEVLAQSSVVLLLTPWPEFLEQKNKFAQKRLIDFKYVI